MVLLKSIYFSELVTTPPWFSAPSCYTASLRVQQPGLTVRTWFFLPKVIPYYIAILVTMLCFQTAVGSNLAFLICIVKHFIPSWALSNKKKIFTIILVGREPGSCMSTMVKLFLHFKDPRTIYRGVFHSNVQVGFRSKEVILENLNWIWMSSRGQTLTLDFSIPNIS